MTGRGRRSRSQAHRVGVAREHPSASIVAGLVVAGVVASAAVATLVAAMTTSPGPVVGEHAPSPPSLDAGVASASPLASSLSPVAAPSASPAPSSSVSPAPSSSVSAVEGDTSSPFGLGLLIADRGNGRLIIVDATGRTLWSFPGPHSLPRGQTFSADDAFLAPDGRTIVANDEGHQVIDRIDIATRRVIWQYGHYGRAGAARGYLHTPDDAYPLANGDVTVADIRNCRILTINPAKQIVRQLGRTGDCRHDPPHSFDNPNGDTPLADGGLLVTEIGGSRVVRLSATGHVVFDIHVPTSYPSDAQLDARGNVLVADYARPGALVEVDPRGHAVWRYRPRSGRGMLDHPSLAIELPSGLIALNDDFRQRVVVIDPRTNRIVWQYGRTDVRGRGPGELFIPDGIDPIPLGTTL